MDMEQWTCEECGCFLMTNSKESLQEEIYKHLGSHQKPAEAVIPVSQYTPEDHLYAHGMGISLEGGD